MFKNLFKNTKFLRKFSRYLLVGLSCMVLVAASQQAVLSEVFQRNTNVVLAQSSEFAGPSTGTINPTTFAKGSQVTFNVNSGNADNIIVQILRDVNGAPADARELGDIPASQFNQNVALTIPADYPTGPALIRFYARKAGLQQEQPANQYDVTVTDAAAPAPQPQQPAATGIAHLAGGDFVQAYNNTTQTGTWRDPVDALPGQVIEFRVTARNDSQTEAHHVQMWGTTTGQVPQGPSNPLVLTAKIATSSYGGNEETDTATVNLPAGVLEGLRYEPGHARINGVTDVYNCPNTCPIPDSVIGGIDVGTIQPGDFVEIAFKARLTNTIVNPTPTPQPPAATPTPAPQGGTNTNVNVNANSNTNVNRNSSNATALAVNNVNIGVGSTGGNNTTNNSTTNNNTTNNNNYYNNVGVGTTTPSGTIVTAAAPAQVLGVTQLPKTGLPIVAWSALAFVPAGFRLRRFSKVSKELENHPSFIHEMRQFKSQA